MHTSKSEEDYLKNIAFLCEKKKDSISTKELAFRMKVSPAGITDMIKKLHQKGLVLYKKYFGIRLSKKGKDVSLKIIRRERIWQYFLVNKLKIDLTNASELAEELEHITSSLLIDRLDDFVGNPIYSPYGKNIPSKDGSIKDEKLVSLNNIEEDNNVIITAMKENNPKLMQYFFKKGIYIGAQVTIVEKLSFDDSLDIMIDNKIKVNISNKVAKNILIKI